MRKISGVLLALAASLALGATTVAAKDYGDGGGGGEKMQNEGKGGGGGENEGKGGGGGEKMRRHEEHGDMEHHHRRGHWRGRKDAKRGQGGQMLSLASCMRRSLGLGRSAFPSLPLAPRLLKSRLSHRPSTAAPRKVAAVCAST